MALIESYKVVDAYNSDIICEDVDMATASVKSKEYDEECEGDWFPLLFARDTSGRYIQIDSDLLKF